MASEIQIQANKRNGELRHRRAVEKWIPLVKEFNESGLSVDDFAHEKNISHTTLYHWLHVFRHEAGGNALSGIGKPNNAITKAYEQPKPTASDGIVHKPEVQMTESSDSVTLQNGLYTVQLPKDATPEQVAAAWSIVSGRSAFSHPAPAKIPANAPAQGFIS